jgi:septal ring factor EnvC (AmiA/AmiB activator)
MGNFLNSIKNLFSSKLGMILGSVLVILVLYFVLPASVKDLSNWVVSAKQHRALVKENERLGKLYLEQKQMLDSVLTIVNQNNEKIKDLENKKVAVETKRTKLKLELKNAKGNIVSLDSLANTIL